MNFEEVSDSPEENRNRHSGVADDTTPGKQPPVPLVDESLAASRVMASAAAPDDELDLPASSTGVNAASAFPAPAIAAASTAERFGAQFLIGATNIVRTSSVEPLGPNEYTSALPEAFARQQQQQHQYGVDPIGRLLTFNQMRAISEQTAASNEQNSHHNHHAASAGASLSSIGDDSSLQVGSPDAVSRTADAASSAVAAAAAARVAIAPEDPKEKKSDANAHVLITVDQRRKMTAALRVPLNNNQHQPSSFLARSSKRREYDDDFCSDDGDASIVDGVESFQKFYYEKDGKKQRGGKESASPVNVLGDLPVYQSPIAGNSDGGMSLVTVLDEYSVLRNCKGWLSEAQHRTLQSMYAQGELLLDWQRRRLEQQSETVLSELGTALNPSTLADMFDAVASALDEVESVLEPALHERVAELTSLHRPSSGSAGDGILDPALQSYTSLLSLEAGRIADHASNIHVALDSAKADLAETRSSDAAFDLDRKQSRRNVALKVANLEEEQRQLKLELRREIKVALDRDRKAKRDFDTVHGQLEGLLRGKEMFDELREEIKDCADQLLHIGNNARHLQEKHLGRDASPASGVGADESPARLPSPSRRRADDQEGSSNNGVHFFQRIAAMSRKLREHGYDLASMLSPARGRDGGTVGAYTALTSACYVDPSLILGTNDAKDLGGIEDVADEFFAPLALEAHAMRTSAPRVPLPSSSSSSSSSSAVIAPRPAAVTPAVPSPLVKHGARYAYLEAEAMRQADEILCDAERRRRLLDGEDEKLQRAREEAQRQVDAMFPGVGAIPPLPSATAAAVHVPSLTTSEPMVGLAGERPRLPTVAIPDGFVEPSRIAPDLIGGPHSPKQRMAQTLNDLVPPALKELISGGGPVLYDDIKPSRPPPPPLTEATSATANPLPRNPYVASELVPYPHQHYSPAAVEPGQQPSRDNHRHRQRQQQQPQPTSPPASHAPLSSSSRAPLPSSISHRVGLPFGSRQADDTGLIHSRGSSVDDTDHSAADKPPTTSGAGAATTGERPPSSGSTAAPTASDSTNNSARPSPVRGRDLLRSRSLTPPHLRGFSTPGAPPDIAYVETQHHSRGGGDAPFFYPQRDGNNGQEKRERQQREEEKQQSSTPTSTRPHNQQQQQQQQTPRPQQQQQSSPTQPPSRSSSSQPKLDQRRQQKQQEQRQRQEEQQQQHSPDRVDVDLYAEEVQQQPPSHDHHHNNEERLFDGIGTLEEDYGYVNGYEDDEGDHYLDYPATDEALTGPTIDLTGEIQQQQQQQRGAKSGGKKPYENIGPRIQITSTHRIPYPHQRPRPQNVPKHGAFSKGVAVVAPVAELAVEPQLHRQQQAQKRASSSSINTPASRRAAAAAVPSSGRRYEDNNSNPYSQTSPRKIPTWLDLMSERTRVEDQFAPEYLDIARLRYEQDRGNQNYELPGLRMPASLSTSAAAAAGDAAHVPPLTVAAAMASASSAGNNNSKLAGLPGMGLPGSRPPVYERKVPSVTEMLRQQKDQQQTKRVAATAVPPAPRPSDPVDGLGTQEDTRRHLDRLKLDNAEAVAKFRTSPVVSKFL